MKPLFWLVGGLVVGVVLALLIGWVLFPVEYYDTPPSKLRADYRKEYVHLVALSYQVEGDLKRVRWRMEALSPNDPMAPLIALTERWIEEERDAELILPMVYLARDLGVSTPAMAAYLKGDSP